MPCPNCGYVEEETDHVEAEPEWRRIDAHVSVDEDPMAEQEEERLATERAKTREPFEVALLRRRGAFP